MDTINKLLKKQAPKRRGKIANRDPTDTTIGATAGDITPNSEDVEPVKANPVFVRWVSDREGCRVGVPEEWLGTPVGAVFGEARNGNGSGRMVEEVEG